MTQAAAWISKQGGAGFLEGSQSLLGWLLRLWIPKPVPRHGIVRMVWAKDALGITSFQVVSKEQRADLDRLRREIKGHRALERRLREHQEKKKKKQIEKTIEAFLKNSSAIRFEELVSGMQVIFAAQRSLLSGQKEHIS